MHDRDDFLSEFPSEADGARVEKDGKFKIPPPARAFFQLGAIASALCALTRLTRGGVARGGTHLRAAAAIARRQLTVPWREWDSPARRFSQSLRSWRDHAGSIRPFVLGIIVGGLMVSYERVIPDQRVTAFVPASEAPAQSEAGPAASADPREDVITSTSPARRPSANPVVSTAGRVGPDDRGRPAPGPEQRGRAPRPRHPYRGSLLVTSTPQGAAVFINGHPAGTTPVVLANLPVGSRAVRVSLDGYDRWSRAVQVVADRRTEVNAVLTVPRPVEGEPRGLE